MMGLKCLTAYITIIITVLSIVTGTLTDTPDCNGVYQYYTQKGFSLNDIQSRTSQKEAVCGSVGSCCNPTMEEKLTELSIQNYGKIIANQTETERSSLIASTAQFNGFFLDLLKESQDELHVMFSTAYGVQYKQNEAVFRKLFASFEKYYRDGSINLVTEVKEFFQEVFSKMFVMLNPSYTFSDRYLLCLKTAMPQLKPFKDIPDTLQRNLRQAFVAARTFVQGLVVGRNAAKNLAQVEPSNACDKALASMTVCPICMALNPVSICQDYCIDVINGCLIHHRRLDSTWKAYIAAMEELAERLDGGGSFNIEHVMAPLKDMISDAIMEYQGSSLTILPKVTDICGQPSTTSFTRLKRRSRSKSHSRSSPSALTNPTSLTELAGEIKDKLIGMKNMWLDLPGKMCSHYSTTSAGQCWNGQNMDGYGIRYKFEMDMEDDSEVARVIDHEINALEEATFHLNNAKRGLDVDWLDLDIDESKQDGNRNEQVETTTNSIRHSDHNPSPDADMEGSGSEPSSWNPGSNSGAYIDLDTEYSDNSDIEVGSGDDHLNAVLESMTARSKVITKHPKNGTDWGRIDIEGSGNDDEDNFLIPVHRPKPDSDFNKHKFTYEGSGYEPLVSYNADDEDNLLPDTKLLSHEQYNQVLLQHRTTTTEVYSSSNSPTINALILFISILFGCGLKR